MRGEPWCSSELFPILSVTQAYKQTLRKKQEKIQDRALAKAQALAEKKRALAERNLPLPLPDAF